MNLPTEFRWVYKSAPLHPIGVILFLITTSALMDSEKKPTRAEIIAHMDGNICRCGTYPRIVRAIERAAREG